MDINKITHPVVHAAVEAWQAGNAEKWASYFVANAILLDDGAVRDFNKFSKNAIGTERFLSIDKVENKGLHIFGKFHSDTWGDFKTYFKFHVNSDNKIDQLEIGQVDY